MAVDGPARSYISSHSAEVILSDIRPIKLRLEALQSINVVLDEILYSILSAAKSLTTDKLRAGLLSILPTPLGKEALLEAEVELRAYWDRNKQMRHKQESDSDTFQLQWAFELLRLKCEAYSTLNESDEDPSAEPRLQEKMRSSGAAAPSAALMAPAALYLTAILESLCEHLLSNVGRVASRDSSRDVATVNDLFVALSEDDHFYASFRKMKVHQQIEALSKATRTRRSKSISSNSQAHGQSRTSSPVSVTSPPHRKSVETSASRSSFDKARNMKRYLPHGRASNDREAESPSGHKRTDSFMSEDAYDGYEDSTEFDDLMKSEQTMKVSLTPDRLRTMEVYRKEKNGNGPSRSPSSQQSFNSNFGPNSFMNANDQQSPPSTQPPRANGRKPSLARVSSIVEDEEDVFPRLAAHSVPPTPRSHPPVPPLPASNGQPQSLRSRSSSTSNKLVRKTSQSGLAPSSSFMPPPPPPAVKTSSSSKLDRMTGGNSSSPFDSDGFPQKTRKIQRKMEDMDLDDIMNDSGDEDDVPLAASKSKASPVAATPARKQSNAKVSSSTRDLMDFLNEGPPDIMASSRPTASGDFAAFLAEGPPDNNGPTSPTGDSMKGGKATKRLQRMMSKLSLGGDKGESPRRNRNTSFSTLNPASSRPTLNSKQSIPSISPLANKPVPPRPHMMSSPTSPTPQETGSVRSQGTFASGAGEKMMPPPTSSMRDPHVNEFGVPAVPTPPPIASAPSSASASTVRSIGGAEYGSPRGTLTKRTPSGGLKTEERPPRSTRVQGSEDSDVPLRQRRPSKPAPSSIQTGATPVTTVPEVPALGEDAQIFKRTLASATSVEECRMLLDLFLAKTGILPKTAEAASKKAADAPYPSPTPSVRPDAISPTTASALKASAPLSPKADWELECQVAEYLLGGGSIKRARIAAPTPAAVPLMSRQSSASSRDFSSAPSSPVGY